MANKLWAGVADYFGMPWVHFYSKNGGYYETAGFEAHGNGEYSLHVPEGGSCRIKLLPIAEDNGPAADYGAPYVRVAEAVDNDDQTAGEQYILVWHNCPAGPPEDLP